MDQHRVSYGNFYLEDLVQFCLRLHRELGSSFSYEYIQVVLGEEEDSSFSLLVGVDTDDLIREYLSCSLSRKVFSFGFKQPRHTIVVLHVHEIVVSPSRRVYS
jgi:hypothetical protein